MAGPASRQVIRAPIVTCDGGRLHPGEDELVVEEPLEIRVAGQPVSVTMRTPGDDRELTVGFLMTEGLIAGREDVQSIEAAEDEAAAEAEAEEAEGAELPGNVIDVALRPGVVVDFERLTRHVFAASSCGICGKASIDAIRARVLAAPARDVTIAPDVLRSLPDTLRAGQTVFGRTGGLHAAGLFDPATGRLLVLREDVGRHNAVDKAIGHAILTGLPLTHSILVISGRGGFEIVQKSLVAGIPIVAAVSAPSSLAVELARDLDQTLIGFLRGARFVIYSGAHRVLSGAV